jgi:hypothetical protein
MSGLGLWNLNKEPDKAKRPDMSGLGAGHVRQEPLETILGVGYVWPGDFDDKINFNLLHFTNSPNGSLLIVRSSLDSNKICNPQF